MVKPGGLRLPIFLYIRRSGSIKLPKPGYCFGDNLRNFILSGRNSEVVKFEKVLDNFGLNLRTKIFLGVGGIQ